MAQEDLSALGEGRRGTSVGEFPKLGEVVGEVCLGTEHSRAGAGDRLRPVMVAVLTLAGCDHHVSHAWEDGGRIEAKVVAERCPDADAGPLLPPKSPRGIVSECKEYSDGEFAILTRLHIVETGEKGEQRVRDQVWRIGCFSGLCEAATLDSSALATDAPLQPFQLEAWRGTVVSHQGRVFNLRFTGMAEQIVRVDLSANTVDYRQTFKSGVTAVGAGSCAGRQ